MPKWIDLTGQKINSITIIDGNLPTDRLNVLAQCDCGTIRLFNKANLLSKRTKTCGEGICNYEFKNLLGKEYGFLKVTRLLGKHPKRNINIWECLCICGKNTVSYSDRLETGNTQSCGCKRIEIASKKNTKPNNHAYLLQKWHSYKWHSLKKNRLFEIDFDLFKELVIKPCHYCGILPQENKSNGIDRKDSNIGYIISNCLTACKDCNYGKRTQSYDDFIKMCKIIAEKFNQ